MSRSHTEESKRKIGAANKGRKRPDLVAFNLARVGQTSPKKGIPVKATEELSWFTKRNMGLELSPEETTQSRAFFSAWSRKNRTTAKGKARSLFYSAKRAAQKHNLPFDITKEWITDKIVMGQCEVSGISFSMTGSAGKGTTGAGNQNPFGPSLDRIIPEHGYTKDNVKVVVWIYNACKNVYTHDTVMVLAKALVEQDSHASLSR